MSKHRKKKKKNKKMVNDTVDQVTQSVATDSPKIENIPTEDRAVILAHQTVRKDLIRILVISLVLLIILAGGIIIRSQTSWVSRGADWIYAWMRLGE